MFHIINTEEFLEGHTSDTCYRVQTCKCQCGYAHGHKALCCECVDTKHFQESGNSGREDLEWCAYGSSSVSGSGSTCNAESYNSQQTFQYHGTIANL